MRPRRFRSSRSKEGTSAESESGREWKEEERSRVVVVRGLLREAVEIQGWLNG